MFIEASKRKLESLQAAVAELTATIEQNRQLLADAEAVIGRAEAVIGKAKPSPFRPILPNLGLTPQTQQEKAAETRAFAEAVSSRKAKRLLLEVADIQERPDTG